MASRPTVRQKEPTSLFSENKKDLDEKIDFSRLDITEAVQYGATERVQSLLASGVSQHTGGGTVE